MNSILKQIKKHRSSLLVIILLFAAKFLGFIKNIFMAKYYGTSSISDAYQMAISIPMIMLGVVLYSYQAFTKGYYKSEKNNTGNNYVCTFINFISVIVLFISFFMLLFLSTIITFFAPGFNEEQFLYTLDLINPIIIGTMFLSISNIFGEYLRCRGIYVVPQFLYLVINVIEILAIFPAFYFNYKWLSYGYLLANFIYFSLLLIFCYKQKFRYKICLSKKQVNLFIKILIPIFVSSIITDINSMIDKIFASEYGTGVISTLSYATNIKTVFLIIAAGYLTVLYSNISKKIVEKKYYEFNKKIKKSLIIILAIYVPLTLLTIAFSKEIVKLVYFRGAFDNNSLVMTTNCLKMYIIGIAGISIRDLYIKSLYCMEKGKFVILISLLSVVINIILNIVLSQKIGYIGLPLATSLSVWLIIPILIVFYKYNINCKIEKKGI